MQRTRPKLNDGRPGSNLSADLSGISKTAGVFRVHYVRSIAVISVQHIRTSDLDDWRGLGREAILR
jgi:hypothetical protein